MTNQGETQITREGSPLIVKDDHLARVLAKEDFLIFDGAMGTMLQARGFDTSSHPELLCLSNPADVTAIHRAYVDAGSEVATTNTFGANALKLKGAAAVDKVFEAAVSCARDAGARYVAADIGPIGSLLEPSGSITFDEAYELFAEQVRAIARTDADIIIIETMSDLLEMKAAVLAAKENSSLPIFATMTFGAHGQTFLGTGPVCAAHTLAALGVSALGANCSLGPADLAPLAAAMANAVDCPIIVQANAGLPHLGKQGNNVYDIDPESYARAASAMLDAGASIIGGCCGTAPAYITRIVELVGTRTSPLKRTGAAPAPTVTSARACATIAEGIAVIPTLTDENKNDVADELSTGDFDTLVDESLEAEDELVDVFVGLEGVDETEALRMAVGKVQEMCARPLQLAGRDPQAVAAAARRYAGKPLIALDATPRELWGELMQSAAHLGCALAFPCPPCRSAADISELERTFDSFQTQAIDAGVSARNLCASVGERFEDDLDPKASDAFRAFANRVALVRFSGRAS